MTAISILTSDKELTRFSRFITVGAIGTVIDFSILTLLKMGGFPTLVANSIFRGRAGQQFHLEPLMDVPRQPAGGLAQAIDAIYAGQFDRAGAQ